MKHLLIQNWKQWSGGKNCYFQSPLQILGFVVLTDRLGTKPITDLLLSPLFPNECFLGAGQGNIYSRQRPGECPSPELWCQTQVHKGISFGSFTAYGWCRVKSQGFVVQSLLIKPDVHIKDQKPWVTCLHSRR